MLWGQLCPMPSGEVKHVHLHVLHRVRLMGPVWSVWAMMVHQHIGMVSHDSKANTQCRDWKMSCGLLVLPGVLLEVKGPQSICRIHKHSANISFTCTGVSHASKLAKLT